VLLALHGRSGTLHVSQLPRLRAPRGHGEILAVPELARWPERLVQNQRSLDSVAIPFLDQPLHTWRKEARRQALAAARHYLLAAGEPLPEFTSEHLVLAGHQPELCHPGVWIKNFALHALARRTGTTPINLVVDNDTLKHPSLRVPAHRRDGTSRRRLAVAFDRVSRETPYEERRVLDREQFRSFGARVLDALGDVPFRPFVSDFWPEVVRQSERTPLVGECFAGARREWERRWGCHNLEVPLSLLCETPAFAAFVAAVLLDLPRFHANYNQCVQNYRSLHGIRSRNHPVPDLAASGDWLEAPFWAWRAGAACRQRLFVRRSSALELRAGEEPWPALRASSLATPSDLRELASQGYNVRSRALTTTLFARLFLADVFLHGIGGAKYDELTDTLIERAYGIEPPGYLVLSGTLLLPLPVYAVSAGAEQHLARTERALLFNPERHVRNSEWEELVEQKTRWIARQASTAPMRRLRRRKLRRLNERLLPAIAEDLARFRERRTTVAHQLRANAVAQRRDYAFCLHPEEALREFCQRCLEDVAGR
jgi:hypothetical protein